MALIPDSKLVLVEPVYIQCPEGYQGADSNEVPGINISGAGSGAATTGKGSFVVRPKVKGVLSTPDVFSKLMSN
eukprot:CAMPEP_0170454752 /NCGR_PEP_ID=MMETSP0123-20130129/2896_1 /TAXON_ID=182087 /ORGANISM="Favella ehrenbergii, Strain Fehren 1" /LENGTH=73 /DNA_ID=CAMNT_0010717563 /DNA_START=1826 /DNA_END=2047 /DNA_ORIENTATION=+